MNDLDNPGLPTEPTPEDDRPFLIPVHTAAYKLGLPAVWLKHKIHLNELPHLHTGPMERDRTLVHLPQLKTAILAAMERHLESTEP